MKLDIPEKDQKVLATWLGPTEEKTDAVLRALEDADPALLPSDLAAHVQARAGIGENEGATLVLALLSMARSRAALTGDADKAAFRDAVVAAITSDASSDDARRDVAGRIDRVLAARSVRLTAKALEVKFGSPNDYCGARTLSELRPLFHDDSLEPEAAVIVHELKLTYHTHPGFERKEIFILMDDGDIKDLSRVLERALKKNSKLIQLADKAGLPVLPVPE